jgi:hypothetical protein
VTGLFGFRRKQLLRGLRELTAWPAERVQLVLETRKVLSSARPETLTPEEFAGLYRALIDGGARFG